MSGVAIQVDVRDHGVQALLERCRSLLRGGSVEQVTGTACRDLTMRHLMELNARRHRGNSYGYYEQAASKVSYTSEPGAVMVSVKHQGLAQRYYGGRIDPVNKNCLAFPVGDSPASSAGHTNELSGGSDLRAIFFKPKVTAHSEIFGALVANSDRVAVGVVSGKGKNAGKTKYATTQTGNILFLLARWVNQDADSTVMPSSKLYLETLRISLRRIAKILGERESAHV